MIEIIEADLRTPSHSETLVQLMDEYARDPMGGGKGLSDDVKANLAPALAMRTTAHVILAFVEDQPAGLVVCFEGFSTFACKPLLNIHDLIVATPYRGMGISKLLLHKVEAIAIALGCCKLTLEVLAGNHVARAAYSACGFRGYELSPQVGQALFWEKQLGEARQD
ncbi:MAG: hypothetical protein RJA70_1604 [Pseudomonadota bacterium]